MASALHSDLLACPIFCIYVWVEPPAHRRSAEKPPHNKVLAPDRDSNPLSGVLRDFKSATLTARPRGPL